MSFMALHVGTKQWDKAIEKGTQSVRLSFDALNYSLPYVSESEQYKLLQHGLQWKNALGLVRLRPGDAATSSATAEWLVNCKGLTLELLAERARLAHAKDDPKLNEVIDALGQVRTQLSRLIYS